MGYYYFNGIEVKKNQKFAILCFKIAADMEEANGLFAYGTLLLKGHKYVDQDFLQGRLLLRKAVKENHFHAVYAYMLALSMGLNYMSC